MVEERVQRRLAAILAADVVGYSRLMGGDEVGTRARFNAHLNELIEPTFAIHRGRIVKTTGDALLAEFASVVDAVECAVGIQNGMTERNVEEPDDRQIIFRIGVNLGDVIIEGDDIHGDGVNVAARLEGLAEPGTVVVSGSVYEQVRGKVGADFDDLGLQEVKNITQPVRAYRVQLRVDTPATSDGSPPQLPDKPSIAVLPFDNMSGDPEQEYFADGLTEDIITALSYWHTFSVIARNSTFQYKGQSPDVRQVAAHLCVQYVLEGSVRKSGDRVRISAQLVDGFTGNHVWAKRFDRNLKDFFDLQDEITELIAAKVEPEFAKAEQKRAARKPPNNLDAWECYQRGIASLNELTKEGNFRAQKLFARAIEIDPSDSRPHSGMAYCLFRYSYDGFSDTPVYASEESIQYAKRGVALDEGDAQAHETLAILLLHSDDPDGSLAAGRRAIEINPNFAHAHVPVGNLLSLTGDPAEGVKYLERAVRLNPDDIRNHIYLALLADAHLNNRDYDQAADWARKSIEWKRDFPHSHMSLASALGHLGEIGVAKLELAECLRLSPNYLRIHPILQFYRDPADREHYLDGLRKAGLPE